MEPREAVSRLKRRAADGSHWFERHLRSIARELPPTLRLLVVTLKWGRIPQTWELDFIVRMKELQKTGVRFDQVLKTVLPQLFGDDTSVVLSSWIGEKATRSPERFVRSVSKMWGPSAHTVIVSINNLTGDPNLFKKAQLEPAIQSLLEAIKKADEAALTAAERERPQSTALALCRPSMLQILDSESDDASADNSE